MILEKYETRRNCCKSEDGLGSKEFAKVLKLTISLQRYLRRSCVFNRGRAKLVLVGKTQHFYV